MGGKLGDTFRLIWTLINPLDCSQNSTAILQADSFAACPHGFISAKILSTFSIKPS